MIEKWLTLLMEPTIKIAGRLVNWLRKKIALNRGGSEIFSYKELLELGKYFKAEEGH